MIIDICHVFYLNINTYHHGTRTNTHVWSTCIQTEIRLKCSINIKRQYGMYGVELQRSVKCDSCKKKWYKHKSEISSQYTYTYSTCCIKKERRCTFHKCANFYSLLCTMPTMTAEAATSTTASCHPANVPINLMI